MTNGTGRRGVVAGWIVAMLTLVGAATPADAIILPVVPRSILKAYFQRGDRPTEAQFGTLIDSMVNKSVVDGGLTPPLSIALDGIAVSGSTNNALRLSEDGVVDVTLTYTAAGNHPELEPLWAGQSGFLPLRFHDDDQPLPNTYYGYLQIYMDDVPAGGAQGFVLSSDPEPPAIHVEYLVYESSPNTSITAAAVPEPGSFALLALCIPLLAGRSRKSRV